MENFNAIIFDMDGALFDAETFYYHRREKFLVEKGISIKHLPPGFFIGGSMRQTWRNILRDDYENWDIHQLQGEYTTYKHNHPLPYKDLIFPDTFEVIKKFYDNGYRLGLASSSIKHDILRALNDTKMRAYFSVILSGEEFPRERPHSATYQEAVWQLGTNHDNILAAEDNEKGIQAGVSADLQVWAIEDKLSGMNQSKANRSANNLTQIFEELID